MGNYMFETVAVSLALLILCCVGKVAQVIWFRPNELEKLLRQQGIRGTSYKLLHGDMRDIKNSFHEAHAKPLSPLDHCIAPRVFPYFHDVMQKYGKVCMIWIGMKPRVIVGEPEMIRQILGDTTGNFGRPPQNPFVDILQMGISTLEGEQWFKRRRKIQPAFHPDSIKGMVPAFLTSCSNLIEQWMKLTDQSDGFCEVDVAKEFNNMAADVISRTAFGSSFQEAKEIFELQREQATLAVEAYYTIYIPGFKFIPTRKNRRRYKLDNEIKAILRETIRRKEKEIIQNRELGPTDLLGLLLQCNNESHDNRLSIEEVIEECKLFYFAGKDTTANLLTWTIVVLSMHPDWQEKAREEVLQMCGHKTPDFETVGRFKIVSMIVNEVLRLYPPLSSVYRYTKRATTIGSGVSIPAGVEVCLNLVSLHHDPEFWGDDSARFNPERFSDGVARSSIVSRDDNSNQIAFYPFGWGPRVCLGQKFAMFETKLALAMILQRFSFELSPSYAHAPRSVITLQPQHGAPIILHRL